MIHEFVRMCESVGMAQTDCVLPPAEDRERLLAIVADRNRPLKHVRRAQIVLCSADRLPGDCPEFRVWFGHNGKKGAIPWPDARAPPFRLRQPQRSAYC